MFKAKVKVTMDSGAVFSVEYNGSDMSFDDKVRFSNPTDFVESVTGERLLLQKMEFFKLEEEAASE
jgi:hypothetical protein